MTTPPNDPRGGIAGVWLVVCLAAGAGGLGFSFLSRGQSDFWIGAQPGGGAALGAAAAVFVLIAVRLARALLRARDDKGGGNGAHP